MFAFDFHCHPATAGRNLTELWSAQRSGVSHSWRPFARPCLMVRYNCSSDDGEPGLALVSLCRPYHMMSKLDQLCIRSGSGIVEAPTRRHMPDGLRSPKDWRTDTEPCRTASPHFFFRGFVIPLPAAVWGGVALPDANESTRRGEQNEPRRAATVSRESRDGGPGGGEACRQWGDGGDSRNDDGGMTHGEAQCISG